MQHITDIIGLRRTLDACRRDGQRIVVVPTMGNLHAGHIHLVEQARLHGEVVVCTIFVNPMQFGRHEDLDSYPRTLAADMEKLRAAGCNVLFAPSVSEIYPQGLDAHTVVSVPEVSQRHCGASRPGHFDGVSTVVSKLFNLVQPQVALFGLKDYQQLMVIRKMVIDLCLPVELVGVPTQREPDGLALSSRNGYLTPEQRRIAPVLYQTLQDAREQVLQGEAFAAVEAAAGRRLTEAGFRPDYIHISHAETLDPAQPGDSRLVILAAAWMGGTRLIDNIEIRLP